MGLAHRALLRTETKTITEARMSQESACYGQANVAKTAFEEPQRHFLQPDFRTMLPHRDGSYTSLTAAPVASSEELQHCDRYTKGVPQMTTLKRAEPRRHHYVPRCWLAGFTDTGAQEGKLFVTDLKRRNQWSAEPGTAGIIRDFYRLEDDRASDPVLAEKALSQIENEIAPILRNIDKEMRPPTVDELEPLLYFIGVQWSRVPAFRPFILGVLDKLSYEQIA